MENGTDMDVENSGDFFYARPTKNKVNIEIFIFIYL
jgi:hypothetical protein